MNNTWIKLHRNIIDWEWFHDKNALMLLIYLNCRVNIIDKKWQGTTIKRGSIALSWETLSERINLSQKQCRTAMKKLEDSGEVTRIRAAKYQVVTLTKWEKMQHNTENMSGKGQAEGMSEGRQRATTKESKERKKDDNGVYFDITNLRINYLNDDRTLNAVLKNGLKGKTKEEIENLTVKFNEHLESTSVHTKTKNDYASHFLSWAKKQKTIKGNKDILKFN